MYVCRHKKKKKKKTKKMYRYIIGSTQYVLTLGLGVVVVVVVVAGVRVVRAVVVGCTGLVGAGSKVWAITGWMGVA